MSRVDGASNIAVPPRTLGVQSLPRKTHGMPGVSHAFLFGTEQSNGRGALYLFLLIFLYFVVKVAR